MGPGKLWLALAAGALATACGSSDSGVPDECNPLGGANCITPWPSSVYAVDDDTTATGRRLAIPEGALPTNLDGIAIDPTRLNQRDGFSAAAPLITAFSTGVDPSNLVPYTEMADSTTDASPTVLIDLSTGERVEHFAEIDARVPDQPDKQALFIRPAARLAPGTRYVAAVRDSLRAADGGPLPVAEGFAALRDGRSFGHPLFERLRPRYDAIFAALEAQGISRDELVVAWDFTTGTDEQLRADLIAARDTALPMIGDTGANLDFTVESDAPFGDGSQIARVITGTFTAPLFLTNDGAFVPGTTLARAADGAPAAQGMYQAPFVASVPECALTAPDPVPVLIYGHGLMGDPDEVTHGASRKVAEALCVVLVGTTWRGMSIGDLPNVASALNNANNGPWIFDTLVQGVVDFISLEHAVRGPMAARLFVDGAGQPLIDPTRVYYYGNSQGGIFGGTVMAYDPFITRGVLGVGAANYSLLLERSQDWPVYRTILIGAYPDPLDVTILISLMQMQWDTTDPGTTMADVLDGGVPGTPPKQLLLHMSLADAEVSNVATEYEARSMGLPVLSPPVYEPHGLEVADGPLASALVQWDGGYPPIPVTNTPPEENEAHQLPRNQPAAYRQMQQFFDTGEIVHTCGSGPCLCAEGACE